ncbi:FixH family protein [Mesorhizobium marinum]|uniref:FixH family protein n=1 Tax=Mesorhizobium marinum TaxID=3228790 RepID=A0ABV3QVX0_9HYPH
MALKSVWLYALAVVGLMLAAFGAFVASPGASPPQAALDQSRTRTSAAGLYVASVEPQVAEIRQGELHAWILTVKTAGGSPLDDAVITVEGGMPDHNHGLPTAPEMTQSLGGGRYLVEGIKFSMTGWWELKFGISAPAGTDTVTFNLVL